MASTFSQLKIELIGTGDQAGTWGATTNTNLGTAIEEAITGSANVTFASSNVALALTDTNTTQTARNLRLNLVGTISNVQYLFVPAIDKQYLITNRLSNSVIISNGSNTGATGTTFTLPAGRSTIVYNDATNINDVITFVSTLGNVTISGGTANAMTITNATITSATINGGTSNGQTYSNVTIVSGSANGISITNAASITSNAATLTNVVITSGRVNSITSNASTFTNATITSATINGGTSNGQTYSNVVILSGSANAISITNSTITTATINGGTANGVTQSNVSIISGNINNITSNASTFTNATITSVTSALTVSVGGTGRTTLTASNVLLGNGTTAVNFVGPGASGNVLTSNGTTWVSQAPTASGITTGKAIAMALIFGF
jgi:hypothetical protein